MSKSKRADAKKFAIKRAKRNRANTNRRSNKRGARGTAFLDIETRGFTELCPISGLPEYIFSGHKS